MAQTVFDIGCRETFGKHVDCARMSKAVHRIEGLEALLGQCYCEVFFTKTIDPEAGEFLCPLIDKEALLIGRIWGWPESSDV